MKKIKYLIPVLLTMICLFVPAIGVQAATYTLEKPVIHAVTNTAEGIQVNWNPVEGAETYTVLRKTGANGGWVKKAITTETSWTDTSPVSGKTYYYAVRCSNADGTKYTSLRDPDGTEIFCIRSRNIFLSSKPDGVGLSWSSLSGVTRYEVLRREAGKTAKDWEVVIETQETSAIDLTAASGKTYEYTVRGVLDQTGMLTYGPVDEAKVKIKTFIAAPEITEITQDGTNVQVSWNAVAGAKTYTVLRKVNDGNWVKKAVVTGTTWTDTAGKTSGNTYTYAIRCSNAKGTAYTGARYDGMSYVYLKTPVIKSANVQSDGVQLEIGVVKCTKSVEIWRADHNGEETLLATLTNNKKNTLTYLDEGVESGYGYTYRAVGIIGDTRVSSAGTEVTFTKISQPEFVAQSFIALYAEQNVNSEQIVIPYMTEVVYLDTVYQGESGRWDRVQYNGETYFMWQDADGADKLMEQKPDYAYVADNMYAQQMLDMAVNILETQNTTYRRNDSTGIPDENGVYGYDCSGLVSYINKNVMKSYVPVFDYYAKVDAMYDAGIIYNEGLHGEFSVEPVLLENIKPGDFIFFNLIGEAGDETNDASMPNHVGMYMGNGEFIHSTHYDWGGDGVFLMPLDEYYTDAITGIRRFVPTEVLPSGETRYINAFRVNLRDAGTADAGVIGTAMGNDPVTVLYTDSRWANIEYQGTNCYIDKDYLSETPANTDFVPKRVNADRITLYSEPTSSCEEKVKVLFWEEVEYGGKYFESNFYVIRYNGRVWYYYTTDDITNVLAEPNQVGTD